MGDKTVSDAVSADSLVIPLIDFGVFLNGDESAKTSTAEAILKGFQTSGFVYLKNHGISKSQISETFAQSAAFFRRPRDQKDALAWTSAKANRGYVRQGREKTTSLTDADAIFAQRAEEGADLKETMEIGREGVADCPNRWPDAFDAEGVRFKQEMIDFFELCKQLHIEIMRAIAIGLRLDKMWFDGYCDAGDNTLRLLHYPAVSSDVFRQNSKQVRAGAHSDYGSITLLFQDMAGGLEVLSPNGNYVSATPIPDTIVVNAGDLLARWSNDTIKSTMHRVVEPSTQANFHPARYSIAYFCNPNYDRLIEAIPGTYRDASERKYKGIHSGEYLIERLTATY